MKKIIRFTLIFLLPFVIVILIALIDKHTSNNHVFDHQNSDTSKNDDFYDYQVITTRTPW